MKKIIFFILCLCLISTQSFAFWVWTPETRKWTNPKYSVKETPQKQLEYGIELAKAEDYKQARVEMHKLIKYYPKAREAADAQFYIAEFEEKNGEYAKAFKSYQTVINQYPFTQRTDDVILRQYEMACRLLEGKGKDKKGFWANISSNTKVADIFEQVIKNSPYGEYAAVSQYKIGLYLKEEGLLQEARDAFEKTVNDYPNSEWAQAARYQIALADADRSAGVGYDQKITETAIEGFNGFVQEYPDAELSNDAKQHIADLRKKEAENNFVIAEFYEKQKKYESAKMYYALIIDQYADTVWAQKALEKMQKIGKNQ